MVDFFVWSKKYYLFSAGEKPVKFIEENTYLINFAKYKLVMFTMAKIMEMGETRRNKIVLYLVNSTIEI